MKIEKQIREYYSALAVPAKESVLPECALESKKNTTVYWKAAALAGGLCVLLLLSVLLLPGMRTPDGPPHISHRPTEGTVTKPTTGNPTEPTRPTDPVAPTSPTAPLVPTAPLDPTAPTEPTKSELTQVPVDFTDFIRLTGVSYQGDWRKTQVSLDRIGQKLGEVSCRIVGLYSDGRGEPGGEYYADSEGNLYDKLPNGASACNNVGTALFAVKDNENAIAALVDGKYYLYTASQ